MAFVATMGFSRMGGSKAKMQSSIRKLGTLIREVKYKSKLESATFRIVFDLGENNGENEDNANQARVTQYWVEKAPGTVLLGKDKEKSLEELKSDDDKDAPPDPNSFQADPRLMKKPEELPSGLYISDIDAGLKDGPIESGRAYIYFLPQGFVSEVAIHLETTDDLHWTLATRPLTGKVDVFTEKKELKDLQSQ